MKMKMDPNSVLGLPGIGPKAIQNIEESLAALSFPEPEPTPPAEPVAEAIVEEIVPQPEVEPVAVAEPVAIPAEEAPVAEKQAPAKKEPKKHVEDEEDDEHKDGVSLDELFAMKPEIFQTSGETEEESADKKKGKKGKKKSVELEFDEELGEVVARKKHKRGGDETGEDW